MTPHRYRIYLRATPEQVWQAITDPQFTARYFPAVVESSFAPGAPIRYLRGDGVTETEGTVEVADPPHRLVTSWRFVYDAALAEEPPSRVEWTITPAGPGLTRLDLVHSDLARSPRAWGIVKDGWVWVLDSLKSLLETGEALPEEDESTRPAAPADTEAGWHRAQAVDANNSVWEMFDAERTPGNDEEMLRRAYAAAYHWQRAADRAPINEARARYLLAKAHLVAGMNERALHYADACAAATRDAGDGAADFDHAYAHEIRARALKATGADAEAETEWAAAKAVRCTDPEDQAIVDADLAIGP